MLPNGDFLYPSFLLYLSVGTQVKGRAFHSPPCPYPFIYNTRTHQFLFYLQSGNPFLSLLILVANYRFGQWGSPFWLPPVLLTCPTLLYFFGMQRVILYFPGSIPRIILFSKDFWFLLAEDGYLENKYGHSVCLMLLMCHLFKSLSTATKARKNMHNARRHIILIYWSFDCRAVTNKSSRHYN